MCASAILFADMSHVLQVISETFQLTTSRPFARVDHVRTRAVRLISRLVQPRLSSLRVSQRWLDEHEAATQKRE